MIKRKRFVSVIFNKYDFQEIAFWNSLMECNELRLIMGAFLSLCIFFDRTLFWIIFSMLGWPYSIKVSPFVLKNYFSWIRNREVIGSAHHQWRYGHICPGCHNTTKSNNNKIFFFLQNLFLLCHISSLWGIKYIIMEVFLCTVCLTVE